MIAGTVPNGTKSPSYVPEPPYGEPPALARLPELAADEKYIAPLAVTWFTAWAIAPSWKAASPEYETSSTMMSHPPARSAMMLLAKDALPLNAVAKPSVAPGAMSAR